MYVLYSTLLTVGIVLALPYFLVKAWRSGKYIDNFSARLGFFKLSQKTPAEKVVWVHAVSVGEALALKPLVALLKKVHPTWRIVLSTTTITGNRVAEERL